MNFAMSWSCGKDSALALHKMIEAGHRPCCLLTMFNSEERRSWFHGATESMLRAYSNALGLPLWAFPTTGEEYAAAFEMALDKARHFGAQACAFGDIDLQANRSWEEERCANRGLEAVFPLWQKPRDEIADEILRLGYKCVIKAINSEKFPHASPKELASFCETWLGRCLDRDFLRQTGDLGGDLCGENGEYHTLAVDGPVFRHPLQYRAGRILRLPGHAAIEIDFM